MQGPTNFKEVAKGGDNAIEILNRGPGWSASGCCEAQTVQTTGYGDFFASADGSLIIRMNSLFMLDTIPISDDDGVELRPMSYAK